MTDMDCECGQGGSVSERVASISFVACSELFGFEHLDVFGGVYDFDEKYVVWTWIDGEENSGCF